jgi:hypothetical protein
LGLGVKNMSSEKISFVYLNKDLIDIFLEKATNRILFAKPAFYESELELIFELQKQEICTDA